MTCNGGQVTETRDWGVVTRYTTLHRHGRVLTDVPFAQVRMMRQQRVPQRGRVVVRVVVMRMELRMVVVVMR